MSKSPSGIRARMSVRARARSVLARWRSRDRALPDFIILGTQKGGTSSLHSYLTDLPQVIGPAWKELHFFAEMPNPNKYSALGLGWYRARFPRRSELLAAGAITGEATPRYMVEAVAMTRIARDLPDSRWVVVLRDPVQRAHSHHTMITRRGLDDSSFADAVTNQLELIEHGDTIPGTTDVIGNDLDYVGGSRYSEQLRVLSSLRPNRPTLVLFSENLFTGHRESFALLHEFLGLPEPDQSKFPHTNIGDSKDEIDPDVRRRLETFFTGANAELATQLRSDQFLTVEPADWPDWILHDQRHDGV